MVGTLNLADLQFLRNSNDKKIAISTAYGSRPAFACLIVARPEPPTTSFQLPTSAPGRLLDETTGVPDVA
jgi:hypothetical protein